jgi:uncharacterized protein YqfA (UPF0365 family)
MNWRVRPLVTYRTIIELISAIKTRRGLQIKAEQDWSHYETGVQVSDEEIATLALTRHKFHRALELFANGHPQTRYLNSGGP